MNPILIIELFDICLLPFLQSVLIKISLNFVERFCFLQLHRVLDIPVVPRVDAAVHHGVPGRLLTAHEVIYAQTRHLRVE